MPWKEFSFLPLKRSSEQKLIWVRKSQEKGRDWEGRQFILPLPSVHVSLAQVESNPQQQKRIWALHPRCSFWKFIVPSELSCRTMLNSMTKQEKELCPWGSLPHAVWHQRGMWRFPLCPDSSTCPLRPLPPLPLWFNSFWALTLPTRAVSWFFLFPPLSISQIHFSHISEFTSLK